MKYIAIIDDEMLSNFNTSQDIDVLSIHVKDKTDCTRIIPLKPIATYMIVNELGESYYLNEGHIEAMQTYERKQILKALFDNEKAIQLEGTVNKILEDENVSSD